MMRSRRSFLMVSLSRGSSNLEESGTEGASKQQIPRDLKKMSRLEQKQQKPRPIEARARTKKRGKGWEVVMASEVDIES